MFICAQLDERGICFTVSVLPNPINAQSVVPIETFDERLLGKKYAGGVFYGLEAQVSHNTVQVFWRDLKGNLVADTEQVKARYGSTEIPINMVNGQGSFKVQADPGTYRIEIISSSGCRTEVEVTV
ncbi:hypothetical protein [Marinobacter sp.]|uniref:hypothetical protein n=1 Tax=Marinobacter sp. TaxID=50741 RepID=UPI001994B6E6|nr:hypothetical protein [Marinobacter sp.]MBC7193915.1 hypothetical protein [Marinobacter sp.]